MTKMTTITIYGKKPQLLCPVTVLVDSQVSDRCPCATCLYDLLMVNNTLKLSRSFDNVQYDCVVNEVAMLCERSVKL